MADTITVTVLRTCDARRVEVNLSLEESLNTLKDIISSSDLGPLKREHQRLFHLGRELKSGGRSLRTLGFGKHDNFLVHLHSTKPKTLELSSDEDEDDVVVEEVVPGRIAGEKRGYAAPNHAAVAMPAGRAEVVDLLESDSDDDDIAVVAPLHASASRKRRRT